MKNLCKAIFTFILATMLIPMAFASNQNVVDPMELEEQGIDLNNAVDEHFEAIPIMDRVDSLPGYDVLLIPNSTADDVGMYSPVNGDFIGTFLTDPTNLSTPICAIVGPDSNVYVSDQLNDGVFVYDRQGNYLYTYCDASDGLNNVRGIDFRNGHLFVTSGDDYVA
jgi:hypothetical protein